MDKKKIRQVMIILTIIGIILFLFRFWYYTFWGSFLIDLLWSLVFCLAIYDLTNQKKNLLIPIILGIMIECFQLIFQLLNLNKGGYYPGYADIYDVIAYIGGGLIAFLIVKNKKNT